MKDPGGRELRLGITVPLDGLPVAQTVVPLARLAQECGFTDVWSAEVGGTDGLTPLAMVAGACPEMRLGTAILPVFTRPPALLAMGAASLQALSGGRFLLGIGTSSSIIVNQWMGVPFEKPYTRMRETVEVLREMLAGKKASNGFRLMTDPTAPVPIYVAALGPKMLRLAGEVADGVILYLFTPQGAREAIAQVHESARAAGRDPSTIDVVARIGVAVDEDEQTLKYMLRRLTTSYAMVDVYNASLSRQGFASEAAELSRLWNAGDRDGAASAVSDAMLDGLYITGSAEQCRQKLQLFRQAGIRTPVLFPISVVGDPAERLERSRGVVRSLSGA